MSTPRTDTGIPSGIETSDLSAGLEDKTADADGTANVSAASPEPTVTVEFTYHHGPHAPGDTVDLGVREANLVVSNQRAKYV